MVTAREGALLAVRGARATAIEHRRLARSSSGGKNALPVVGEPPVFCVWYVVASPGRPQMASSYEPNVTRLNLATVAAPRVPLTRPMRRGGSTNARWGWGARAPPAKITTALTTPSANCAEYSALKSGVGAQSDEAVQRRGEHRLGPLLPCLR